MSTLDILRCEQCGKSFLRAPTGNPARYCSKGCRNRAYYLASSNRKRRTGEKSERKPRTRTEDRKRYEAEYQRRPEVMERNRDRARDNYVPHPRSSAPKYDTNIPVSAPYTGHKWLQMAKEVIGDFNPNYEQAEDRWDEMGEAVLALLEGRDMAEAVKEYRRREFIPRYLTHHITEWSGDDDLRQNRWDAIMPQAPSAEDEAILKEDVERAYRKVAYHHGSNTAIGRKKNKQQKPSRRRMKDAGWRKHLTTL